MTEREYILATDIRALDCALACLGQITPAKSAHIEDRTWAYIIEHLRVYHERMRDYIEKNGGLTE